MSQADLSVTATAPLADATCLGLWGLVLRGSGLAPDQLPPVEMVAALQRLADTDVALATALQSFTPPAAAKRAAADCANAADQLTNAAWQLPLLLVGHFGQTASYASEADGAAAGGSLQAQLLALCHLVLRHRALEVRFAAQLEEQKTAAIYQFAYGLSHELNNPLANIATRAGMLIREEPHPQRVRMLESIVNHSMRGCEMLGDLMLVARPPELRKELTRLDQLIGRVLARAEPWAEPFQVTMRAALNSPRLACVDADALTEALWAILRNAIESMPDGGEIAVSLSEQPAATDTLRPLLIEIVDQGAGLSQEALQHCFDPYYSGREAGRGLGLGLAKARKIVDLHGGQLTLTNRPGGGCVARVVLPGS